MRKRGRRRKRSRHTAFGPMQTMILAMAAFVVMVTAHNVMFRAVNDPPPVRAAPVMIEVPGLTQAAARQLSKLSPHQVAGLRHYVAVSCRNLAWQKAHMPACYAAATQGWR